MNSCKVTLNKCIYCFKTDYLCSLWVLNEPETTASYFFVALMAEMQRAGVG